MMKKQLEGMVLTLLNFRIMFLSVGGKECDKKTSIEPKNAKNQQ
jgi:hypothetical protein